MKDQITEMSTRDDVPLPIGEEKYKLAFGAAKVF